MGIVRTDLSVAPPRGERGLKPVTLTLYTTAHRVAPPRGERGLKLLLGFAGCKSRHVAPPRGERGLKPSTENKKGAQYASLPLVGSVD